MYVYLERYEEPAIFNKIPQLYPIQDRDASCKSKGYKIAYTPSICYMRNGAYDLKSNCKCTDENDNCMVCYDSIDINKHNKNIIKEMKNNENNENNLI